MPRLVVGISGASGAIYGVRTLEALRLVHDLETHLVVTPAARRTIALETDRSAEQIDALADVVHAPRDVAASISSGSFQTIGMIVIPCSIRTLAGIASSISDNLLLRAVDVALKERRKVVLVLRETPLHLGHLRTMVHVAELGAIVMPAMPAFYHRPRTVDEIVDQTVNRALDLVGVELPRDLFQRWEGPGERAVT